MNQLTGAVLQEIAEERRHQVEDEGWTPEHDDQHRHGELAIAAVLAAAAYAEVALEDDPTGRATGWPWANNTRKPTTPRRDLIKAAALIVAEIERLDRAAAR